MFLDRFIKQTKLLILNGEFMLQRLIKKFLRNLVIILFGVLVISITSCSLSGNKKSPVINDYLEPFVDANGWQLTEIAYLDGNKYQYNYL